MRYPGRFQIATLFELKHGLLQPLKARAETYLNVNPSLEGNIRHPLLPSLEFYTQVPFQLGSTSCWRSICCRAKRAKSKKASSTEHLGIECQAPTPEFVLDLPSPCMLSLHNRSPFHFAVEMLENTQPAEKPKNCPSEEKIGLAKQFEGPIRDRGPIMK